MQEEYLKRFNDICNSHKITFRPNEVLVRTVPSPHKNKQSFSIGKPVGKNKFWPAAAARAEIKEGEIIPESIIDRIKSDKVKYLLNNPKAPIENSTLYIIEPSGRSEIRGFDWSRLGVINKKVADAPTQNTFGSPRFFRAVDSKGYSTEVNFVSDAKFKMSKSKPKQVVPITLDDGRKFNVDVIYITPRGC